MTLRTPRPPYLKGRVACVHVLPVSSVFRLYSSASRIIASMLLRANGSTYACDVLRSEDVVHPRRRCIARQKEHRPVGVEVLDSLTDEVNLAGASG